ncbi:MAG: hypothetical protein WDO14_10340 [Bacteroidota bacterium]
MISIGSFAQSEAVKYLDVIGEQYQKINHEMMSYTSAVNHGKSARKVEKRRTDLMQQVKESETTVRKLKPFNGSSTLRDSIAAYFRMSGILLNKDYSKIVDMEEVAERSYDDMEAYLLAKEMAEAKLDTAADHAHDQYNAFAASNNIKLIESESELSKKMAKTDKITQYVNKAYLLFFKSYKNEAYLMDAVSRNDLTAIEQSRNALSASAVEDLQKSGTLTAFNGDLSLKAALQQVLNFYKSEANDKIKIHSEFLLSKDNFDKLKKNMDAMPASKRTKEVVDSYNKAADDFNKKVNAVNAMHQDLNKKRSAALDAWNDAYEKFLDKHTPKYK